MKRLLLLLVTVLTSAAMYAQENQQSPLYFLFNSSCMNQLEYRYAYSGASVISYSFMPDANKLYVLNSGNSGLKSPTLPQGTVDCRNMKLDGNFLDMVNKLQRQVYMVHQTQQGYTLMPIISAMNIERTGSYYFFRHPDYTFALDTSNLVYQANLATSGSPNYVYFNGLNIRQCQFQYSFKSEPTMDNKEKSDFDFVPGIGLVSSRSGVNATEMEKNQLRLWFVNGLALEDYLTNVCGGKVVSNPPVAPPGGVNQPTLVDKEQGSIPTAIGPNPVQPQTGAMVGNCPTPAGVGYHIVQPKETLLSISRAYDVPLKSLVRWNNIDNPDMIYPCQQVYVVNPASISSANTPGPVARNQSELWDGNQGAVTPVTSNVDEKKNKMMGGQVTKTTPSTQPNTVMVPVHVVQSGETLHGIALKYGCTDAEFRRINYLPAVGEVTIFPGQQLFVSGCSGQPAAPVQPVNGTDLRPLEHSTTQPNTNTLQPVAQRQFIETSVLNNTTTPTTPNNPVRKATYYQEYVVQQGDTMNSIAIKYKTSAQELALLNNKEVNEVLIAGQRILIPKQ